MRIGYCIGGTLHGEVKSTDVDFDLEPIDSLTQEYYFHKYVDPFYGREIGFWSLHQDLFNALDELIAKAVADE